MIATDKVDVKIPRPLADCFDFFDTECVRECCGIDSIYAAAAPTGSE